MSQRITFETLDGVVIVGDLSCPDNASIAVLLLHMMPATRQSWQPLSDELNKNDIATLAVDLRGHGESTQRHNFPTQQNHVTLDYKSFADRDHQASRLDVDASLIFLKSKGFEEKNIRVAGASIGANLTLDALDRYCCIPKGILLSPGLDYRGVTTENALKVLAADQHVWIIAAEGDEYSAESSKKLAPLKPSCVKLSILSGGEHGTNLFGVNKKLCSEIAKFLK